MKKEAIQVDIQIPFCTGHCVYCGKQSLGENVGYLQRYRTALERELTASSEELAAYQIRSVHIGCDSLSLLGLGALDDFLYSVEKNIPTDPETEWIVDLQPQELTEEMLYVLCHRHSVNAVRLELMALDQKDLLTLHTPFTANLADYALSFLETHQGDKRPFLLSISLGIGLPGQTGQRFAEVLTRILSIKPDQILLKRYRNRRLSTEEQVQLAEETDWGLFIRTAEQNLVPEGFARTENSLVFARPGRLLCTDDPKMIQANQYGFGLNAKTRLEGLTYTNTGDYSFYIQNSDDPQKLAQL